MTEPLEIEFQVDCSVEHAFDMWARKTTLWWPKGHSRSGNPELVTIEGRVGGRIFERSPDGEEHDWGEVTEWDAPHRLSYLWHIYGDRADATQVEVTFRPQGDGTSVQIVHSGWDRLGDKGRDLRERNRAGWDGLLTGFSAACAEVG